MHDELKDTNIQICYAIDQDYSGEIDGLTVVRKEDAWEEVDAIVVTPVFAYEAIKRDIEGCHG